MPTRWAIRASGVGFAFMDWSSIPTLRIVDVISARRLPQCGEIALGRVMVRRRRHSRENIYTLASGMK